MPNPETFFTTPAIVCLAMLAACGPQRTHWNGDPELFGVDLVVSPEAEPYAKAPDTEARVKLVIEKTASYLGYDANDLAGARLIFEGDFLSCPGVDHPAAGCWQGEANTLAVSTSPFLCIEGTCIPHEMLHYFIGDTQHTDPRWRAMNSFLISLIPPDCIPDGITRYCGW